MRFFKQISIYFKILPTTPCQFTFIKTAMLSDRLQVNLQFDNLPCTIDVLFDYFFCFTSFNVSCSGAAFHAAKPRCYFS